MSLWRRATAEAIAAFALVFAGCGAVVADAQYQALGPVGVSLTFGLVIMAMVYAIYVVGPLAGAAVGALYYQLVRGDAR